MRLIGNVFILVLTAFNLMLRYGAVNGLPLACLILSAIVLVGIHVTGWMGWTMVYRHGVGVTAGKAGERSRQALSPSARERTTQDPSKFTVQDYPSILKPRARHPCVIRLMREFDGRP